MSQIFRCGLLWNGEAFLPNAALVVSHGKVLANTFESSEEETDLGPDSVILPGLINAHVHLDLSFARIPPTDNFILWIQKVLEHRMELSPKTTLEAIRVGIQESLQSGVTSLGDISPNGASWEVLEELGLKGTIYRECLGLTPERVESTLCQWEEWLIHHEPTKSIQPGISPHAPFTTSRKIFEFAAHCGLPVTTHLGETPEEVQFLSHRDGPIGELLLKKGIDPALCHFQSVGEVVQIFAKTHRLGLVHSNYGEIAYPLGVGQFRVHCPGTHSYFSRKSHPFDHPKFFPQEWILATDGRSSNADLNLWSQVKKVAKDRPNIAPEALLRMVTVNPAKMMGMGKQIGKLLPQMAADFVIGRFNRPVGKEEIPTKKIFDEIEEFESIWVNGEAKKANS